MKCLKRHGHLALRAVVSLLVAAALVSLTRAEAILQPLNPADPPEVIRENHQYNLKLLRQELQREISEIQSRRDQTISQCASTKCRSDARRKADRDIRLARERHSIQAEQQEIKLRSALDASEKRRREEAASREKEIEDQRVRHEQQTRELQKTRDQERRRLIERSAGEAGVVEEMLDAGDGAVTRPQATPYGSVAGRFQPRRKEYAPRRWGNTGARTLRDSSKPADGTAIECTRDNWDTPTCQARRVQSQIERLEVFQRMSPTPEVGAQIEALKESLKALARQSDAAQRESGGE